MRTLNPAILITALLSFALAHGVVLAAEADAPRATTAVPAAPGWVQGRIATYEAQGSHPDALEIWRLSHQGREAYLFIANCCDQYNPMYDASGKFICAPNGGIVGRGDGQCPGALHASPERVRIWEAPQLRQRAR